MLDSATEVLLRDGSTVHVRRVTPGDRDLIAQFLQALSPESRRLRFFSGAANTEEEAAARSPWTRHDRTP